MPAVVTMDANFFFDQLLGCTTKCVYISMLQIQLMKASSYFKIRRVLGTMLEMERGQMSISTSIFCSVFSTAVTNTKHTTDTTVHMWAPSTCVGTNLKSAIIHNDLP